MNQTEIDLKNTQYMLHRSEQMLEFLTGCPSFGDNDGMNGSCQECYHKDPIQFNRCFAIGHAFTEYRAAVQKLKEPAPIIPHPQDTPAF